MSVVDVAVLGAGKCTMIFNPRIVITWDDFYIPAVRKLGSRRSNFVFTDLHPPFIYLKIPRSNLYVQQKHGIVLSKLIAGL